MKAKILNKLRANFFLVFFKQKSPLFRKTLDKPPRTERV